MIRLHVDLFIKYVSNNVYSDNNHGQPQCLYWIYSLLFLVAYTLWQPFVAYISVWYVISLVFNFVGNARDENEWVGGIV